MAMKLEMDVKHPSFKSSKALSKAGLVLKTTATEGELDTCGVGDAAFGVALKATENPHNLGTYLKGQKVPMAFHGIVELVLYGNRDISVGQMLVTASHGTVERGSVAADKSIAIAEIAGKVGIALEAVSSGAASCVNKVRALLDMEHIV